MQSIPKPALWLGLAGLIPFMYGAATHLAPDLAVTPLAGGAMLRLYGVVILCFMAGVLWGFVARAPQQEWPLYVASVAPALLAFVPAMFAPDLYEGQGGILVVLAGFIILLAIDNWFSGRGLTPDWWMRLRTLLTAIVCICLVVGALA